MIRFQTEVPFLQTLAYEYLAQHLPGCLTWCFWHRMSGAGRVWPISSSTFPPPPECEICQAQAISVLWLPQVLAECLVYGEATIYILYILRTQQICVE